MDQIQWKIIVTVIRKAIKSLPKSRRFKYSDFLIVAMYFWAVKHDRAMMWSCDKANYHSLFRPRKLPSISQFHRRVRSARVSAILQKVHDLMTPGEQTQSCLIVDGKPLTVSNISKDPDARKGHVAGGFAKGYKLHAIMNLSGDFLTWCVRPLNEHEMPVATLLLETLPPLSTDAITLSDGNYDAHDFHKAVDAKGARLICHLRGIAEHPVTLRQMGHARRELLALAKQQPQALKIALKQRRKIETRFGNLTTSGLGPLPYFVRRLPRVRRWTGAKLCLYQARRHARKLAAKTEG